MIFTISENKKLKNTAKVKAGSTPAFGSYPVIILKTVFAAVGTALFWFILWYALAAYIDKEIILPRPTTVIVNLFALMHNSGFWISCGTTILRILCGTIIGCISGILLAVLMLTSKIAYTLVNPLLSAVKATPVASFIIAALFWISRGDVPSFISFLIVLPIICDAVYTGIQSADRALLEVAAVYKFSAIKKILHIYIPSAVPYFLTAVRTSIGMAWKSGVAAEVLCTPNNSIGKALNMTKVYMETADMFAWTLTVILLSIIFEKITVFLVEKGLNKYSTRKDENNAEA